MPGITITRYDVNDTNVNKIADKERVQRQKDIAKKWQYYDGDHHRWLKVRRGEKDDNIVLNLCGRAVDKAVEFIGTPTGFDVPYIEDMERAAGDNEAAEHPLDTALDELYDAEQESLPEVIQSGMIAGHTFVKLYFDSDNQAAETLLDPLYVTVFWNAMNIKQVMFYRLQWKTGDKVYLQDIVPDWLITPPDELPISPVATYWMIYDYEQTKSAQTPWHKLREQRWEYDFAPLVEWAHKRRPHAFYGESFLKDAIQLNDALNFVASNTGRVLKHHAHPKTFVFGAEIEAENAVGGLWDGLPTDAKVQTMELNSDLKSSMAFIDLLKGEFFSTQRVVDTASIRDKLGQITNFGVRMLFNDMLEMTDEARARIGAGFGEVLRRMMIMNSHDLPGKLEPEWPDPLPSNRIEVVGAAKIEKELGTTSQYTLAEAIGRDPSKEEQLKANEVSTSSNALVNTLTQIGQGGLFNA